MSDFDRPQIVNGRMQADVAVQVVPGAAGVVGAKLFWDHVTTPANFSSGAYTTTHARAGGTLFIHEVSFRLTTETAML